MSILLMTIGEYIERRRMGGLIGIILGIVVVILIVINADKKSSEHVRHIQAAKRKVNQGASSLDALKKQYHPLALMLCTHISGLPQIQSSQNVFLLACKNMLEMQSESNPPIIINLDYPSIILVTEYVDANSMECLRINYQSDDEKKSLCFSYSNSAIKAFNQRAGEFFSSDFITVLKSKISPAKTTTTL